MPRTTDPRRVLATDAVFFPDSHVFGSIPRQYPEVSKPLKYMAVQQGSVFHAMPARNNDGQWEMWPASWGYVYGPVDPSTEFGDVEGATYAYDTGTHWKFAACSPQEQIDFAADVRTFAIDQFAVAIAKAQVKVAEGDQRACEGRGGLQAVGPRQLRRCGRSTLPQHGGQGSPRPLPRGPPQRPPQGSGGCWH